MKRAALTPAQQAAYDQLLYAYREAAEKPFEVWAVDSDYCGYLRHHSNLYSTYEEKLAYLTKRHGAAYAASYDADSRETHKMFSNGVIYTRLNTNTLKALERKGYIKAVEIGGRLHDTIKLLIF